MMLGSHVGQASVINASNLAETFDEDQLVSFQPSRLWNLQ
jgi:hypothetical protein